MKTQKFTFVLLAFLVAGTTLGVSFQGCIAVQDGKCTECYHRLALSSGQGCGAQRPAGDNCAIYTYKNSFNRVQCSSCDPGYALKILPAKPPVCGSITIADCRVETIFNIGIVASIICHACENGKYSVTPLSSPYRISSCKTIQNSVRNCRYGGSVVNGNPNCYRCDPGFSVDLRTGHCVRAVIPGCAVVQGGSCLICDPEQGYSMDSNGRCFR